MEPWHRVVKPRKEVREGRSFNPDEFAIHLEQVVSGIAPEDYQDPVQFFKRTCFTRALTDHAGMVLRRLSGETANTAPVMTLLTQFGGGKTHTLASLYHLVTSADKVVHEPEVTAFLRKAGIQSVPQARVAAFVGSAWDPQEGRETPWTDIAWQLAGKKGVEALGPTAATTPPGTESISNLFSAVDAPVLLLFDEVLNYLNRHRSMAEPFHAFIQNLTIAVTGTTHGAAMISLPRSQVEMTDWDYEWQQKVIKVVKRVATDLIANDESEISKVVCRRLFEETGGERTVRNAANAYANWCFERRAQLPSEWTAVDSALTESRARDFLRERFESCYPFHPATLTVFQRKWQALQQYQQTRGTLAMLAQWIARAYLSDFKQARKEPLITLGSAPLEMPEFRAVVLGQLGEQRLNAALDADIAGFHSHARALDADTQGQLHDIHRRVGTTVFFESTGGQADKVAHLPELRFALGEPGIDTTTIDNAALALENKAYFIRKVGTDGFQIRYQPTVKKVVSDRRAALDWDSEVRPEIKNVVKQEFEKGAKPPAVFFPEDSSAIQDLPRLSLVVADPGWSWTENGDVRGRVIEWTTKRGESSRLYPGSLVWCVAKGDKELREAVENRLAWRRVAKEHAEGLLGTDIERSDAMEIQTQHKSADDNARDEVWSTYRYVVLTDRREPDGFRVIDLGAGHASAGQSLWTRVIAVLMSEGILSESVGAGYLERSWPQAFKDSGAWPMSSLRQTLTNGMLLGGESDDKTRSLVRLVNPEEALRTKIPAFVQNGDLGFASGRKPEGGYVRVWFRESISQDDVTFDAESYLLAKAAAEVLTKAPILGEGGGGEQMGGGGGEAEPEGGDGGGIGTPPIDVQTVQTFRIRGQVPPEIWNRMGTKLIPKLRSGKTATFVVEFAATVDSAQAKSFEADLRQAIEDLGLSGQVRIDKGERKDAD